MVGSFWLAGCVSPAAAPAFRWAWAGGHPHGGAVAAEVAASVVVWWPRTSPPDGAHGLSAFLPPLEFTPVTATLTCAWQCATAPSATHPHAHGTVAG